MKHYHFIISLILLAISLPGYSSGKYYHRKNDFTKLSIAPYAGGMVYGVKYQSGNSDFNYGYIVGGQLEIRPYEKVSFITGYSYNKFKDIQVFSFVPALFNYYYAENKSICAGPVLFFEQQEDPYIGGIIGYKVEYFGLYFIYNPRLPIEETEDKIRVFLGLGLVVQLPIKIL